METTSNSKVKVCNISELQPGQTKSLKVKDKDIAIFNVDAKLYAIDNMCIHAGAPLSEGFIDVEKCQVTCNWHSWVFDLSTGKCVSHPRQDVFSGTYPVQVVGDEVFVEVK